METRRVRAVTGAVVLLATLVVLAPTLRPGYVLTYDMVFVPRQPLTGNLLGLGWATPRAVPSDLVVALAGQVVSGQIVQKLVLFALVAGAGWGAARLCPLGGIAPAATALAYLWTPYLGSHLLLGQWAVLVGYAALPWVVRAALDVRAGLPRAGLPRAELALFTALAVGALGGASSWLITGPAALLVLLARRRPFATTRARWTFAGTVVSCVVFAAPWAVPALLRPDRPGTDLAAAAGFAAHADTHLGVVGSVLTGNGLWNSGAEVPGHDTYLYSLGAVAVFALAGYGWSTLRGWDGAAAVAGVGLLGLAIALASTVPVLRHALAELPGGGLVRDATRYLPGWVLVLALGFAAALEALRVRLRDTNWATASTLLIGLPVAILPALGWGVGDRLRPVRYPADISAAVRLVDADPRPGVVAVLPFTTYRAYGWNDGRPVLDVLPRWFDRPVVYASDLPITVHGAPADIAGDDPFAARVGVQLRAHAPSTLGALGVRWIVVDAAVPSVDVTGLTLRLLGPDVTVYEIADVNAAAARHPGAGDRSPRGPVVAGAVVWLAVLGAAPLSWACYGAYCLVTSARARAKPSYDERGAD